MKGKSGFTITELIIVISIIAILATITIVGYGAWKSSTLSAAVKSDLSGVATSMENALVFNNSYPLTIPSTFTASDNVSLSGGGSVDGTTYCVDGVSTEDASILFYISSATKNQGALEGSCP